MLKYVTAKQTSETIPATHGFLQFVSGSDGPLRHLQTCLAAEERRQGAVGGRQLDRRSRTGDEQTADSGRACRQRPTVSWDQTD